MRPAFAAIFSHNMLGRVSTSRWRALSRLAGFCALLGASNGCGTTTDSLGRDDPQPADFGPLTGPTSYPNLFRSLLGKTDAEINARIHAAFQQLFYGDPATQTIYFPVVEGQAYIEDVLHDDVRTEGMGWGMLICVQLDKRSEFDQLWTYTKENLAITSGPARGYFQSSCDLEMGSIPCYDPFGHQQLLMALLFANNRWKASPGNIDYAADARDVLDVIRNKESENGGVVLGTTNMLDERSQLMFDFPDISAVGKTRPSVIMPAYYELLAQATRDRSWVEIARAGREYWKRSAHATTGLTPVRAYFDGMPVSGWEAFGPEAYRANVNMALDGLWNAQDPWVLENSSRILTFFSEVGIDTYGAVYGIDGTPIDSLRESALIVTNGISAVAAEVPDRSAYVQAVWDLETPAGGARYFSGLLDLLALLMLSGNFRVY